MAPHYTTDINEDEPSERAFWSAVTTLTLGILGSSLLPVPWAFSRLGIFVGGALALLVAMANAYTGTILIRAAGHLEKRTYEGVVAATFGSPHFRTLAQLSLVSLLFGTLAGDAALLADTGTLTLIDLSSSGTIPAYLQNGRIPMLFIVLLLVLPISLSRRMRSLERAAVAGVGLVVVLAAVIIYAAAVAHFPAVASGELPWFKVAPSAGPQLPEAMSVLFFAFYTQPMLLPLLSEMPEGRRGQDILCAALQLVTVVIAFLVYAVVGIFGAARYGLDTKGDVLMNDWLPGRASGVLDLSMTVYLSISMAPMAITMRYLLESVVANGELVFTAAGRGRDVGFTVGGIAAATAVAVAWPSAAEKLFAVTGATAVCIVSYVLPVAVHLKLYVTRRRRAPVESDREAWLLEDAAMLEGGAGGGSSVNLVGGGGGGGGDGDELTQGLIIDRRESSVVENAVSDVHRVGNASAAPEAAFDGRVHIYSYVNRGAAVVERPGGYPHISQLRSVPWWKKVVLMTWHVGTPLLCLLLGVGTSVSSLILALRKL